MLAPGPAGRHPAGMNTSPVLPPVSGSATFVLYCLIRRRPAPDGPEQFLLVEKQGLPCFPATKFRPGEDLFRALVRPMEEDLRLPAGCYAPERELPAIPSAGKSIRDPRLPRQWFLYPVSVSLSAAGWAALEKQPGAWCTLAEIRDRAEDLNLRAIVALLAEQPAALGPVPGAPSMDALAGRWAAAHPDGVRVVRRTDIAQVLDAGDRAWNLRVADPYLPYQRQGLGFTWSFFTPKDRQDIHVHGLPAVEIYGVMEGRLQLWHKPMNQRGVRVWRAQVLGPGDWAEVEPLSCHLACWLEREGVGTVIKACAEGELAGVGRLGASGKTSCEWKTADGRRQHCANWQQCAYPPPLLALAAEYARPYEERDYARIAAVAEAAQREWGSPAPAA